MKSKWSEESAITSGTALWAVKQTRAAGNAVCPLTGESIDKSRPWSVFQGWEAIAESAEVHAPELIQVAASELNRRGISDMDDAQCCITFPRYFVNQYDPMIKGRFEPISRREIEGAVGLRQGERVHGLSLESLSKLSPTLERYLADRFNTPLWQPPAPPAPPSADEVAQAERAAKQLQATLNVARALAGSLATPKNDDVGRAAMLLHAIKEFFAA